MFTVTSGFAVFRGEVNTAAHTTAAMRHDAETAFQDGRHDCDVGSMPKQLSVSNFVVGLKPLVLKYILYNTLYTLFKSRSAMILDRRLADCFESVCLNPLNL